jgi:hypothetical protein
MKKLFACITLLLCAAGSWAGVNPGKVMVLKRAPVEIKVDGEIEAAWSHADSTDYFFQLMPYHGKPPSQRTVAKLLTTDESLYCLIICYDKRGDIAANTGKLDDATGDNVSLMLDTFGNNRTAYKFAVFASGVRSDCRLIDDARNRDYSWDGIWFADARVYDWGFVVEMRIPYKSIQYDGKLDVWGLDFDRWSYKRNEDLYWCEYEESEGQRISKFGKLFFNGSKPVVKGRHLEIYPVAFNKATYLHENSYDMEPDIGLDVLYNPSPKLNFQLTVNPDFAQIEADPFEFNISRYESYFSERRPFFTEGNEIFMASGRQRNTGFYRPLELFYSRRIGQKLPDGAEVPLLMGTKAFGRVNSWEYGGFVAMTGKKNYQDDGERYTEEQAIFGSVRLKRQIMGNSSIGFLYVGKHSADHNGGVLDIDGAFRTSDWQLAYQVARSFKDNEGDFAASAGFTMFRDNLLWFARGRYIGEKFDVDDVGFVPWKGTGEFVSLAGPRWYFEKGTIRSILFYVGPVLQYEKVDRFTDYGGLIGFNMQFRRNWGFEINFDMEDAKEEDKRFTAYSCNLSSWFNVSPNWRGNFYGGYSRTYNFSRDYLAFYSWMGSYLEIQALKTLAMGTSANVFVEGNPEGGVEDVTFNARPYLSVTPVNNLNLRLYVDNLYVRSTDHLERVLLGFLFSYNFSPKSWIYLAINEIRDRSDEFDSLGNLQLNRMHVVDRVGVVKLKYLYYF